jgi:3-oxoacyl-[acyl-carrier-protein] synthase-1
MSGFPLAITGLGMVSAVGWDVVGSCAAIRAGINRFKEVDTFGARARHEEGEPQPVVASPVLPGRDPDWAVRLLTLALEDLIRNARLKRKDLSRIRLVVSLPEPTLSPVHAALHKTLLPRLVARTGLPSSASVVSHGGNAGMLRCVQDALTAVAQPRWEACIVAGVDSHLFSEELARLDRAGRLKSERNRDGFIPGECATAVLLERHSDAVKRGVAPIASVVSAGTALEKSPLGSGEQSTGEGLATAIRTACAAGLPQGASWVACDLNSESYRFREWGVVRVRLAQELNGLRRLWHPADCLGDVGASTGGVLMAVASRSFQRGYAPAERALLWAGNDDGQRTALVLARA